MERPPQPIPPLFLYFYISLAERPIGVETIELGKFETTNSAKDTFSRVRLIFLVAYRVG